MPAVRHVVFSDSVIRSSNKGFGIQDVLAGTVSDILVSGITMELDRRHWNWWGSAEPFSITIGDATPEAKGNIRDVVIENVVAHARGTSRIAGIPGHPIESITLRNIDVEMRPENAKDKRATDGFQFEHIKDCRVRGLRVRWTENETEPKWSSAAVFRSIGFLDLNGFTGRQGLRSSNAPAILFDAVAQGRMAATRALPGTDTLFSVKASDKGKLLFLDTDAREAKREFDLQ